MYTKLKKGGFIIETPIGNYFPDWAITYDEVTGDFNLYFIVETKIEKTWEDLLPAEKIKIKCGILHFGAVSNLPKEQIKFDWANSYRDLRINLM